MRKIYRALAWVSAGLLGGLLHAGPLEGVVVIANKSVQLDHISATALKNVYTGRTSYWEGGGSVVIAVLADKTDKQLNEVSGMDASQFRTFWQRLVFSGRGLEPKKAADAEALVALVATTRGAIALAPADAPLEGVKVLEVK